MVKVDGIMMLNPEYIDWKEAQESGGGGGVQPSAPPEAQMAATDATGVPMVSATYVDDDDSPSQPTPSAGAAAAAAASPYVAPANVQLTQPHQHEPMSTVPITTPPHHHQSTVPAPHQGGFSSPVNHLPPGHHHHPPPPPPPGRPGQRPPQYHGKYGLRPVNITCPHCYRQTRTRTEEVIGTGTLIAVFVLLFFFWPLFWLPFVIPDCKQVDHYCAYCGAKVGEKPSSCCSDGCC